MGNVQARRRLLDYDVYEAGVVVPVVAADGVTFTELLRVVVPSLPYRVRISFTISLQANVAGQQTSFLAGILPVGGNLLNLIKGHPAYNVGAASGANAEPAGRPVTGWRVLSPNRPGTYILGATRSTANAGNMIGSGLTPSELLAENIEL